MITKSKLQEIIKEEYKKALEEVYLWDPRFKIEKFYDFNKDDPDFLKNYIN